MPLIRRCTCCVNPQKKQNKKNLIKKPKPSLSCALSFSFCVRRSLHLTFSPRTGRMRNVLGSWDRHTACLSRSARLALFLPSHANERISSNLFTHTLGQAIWEKTNSNYAPLPLCKSDKPNKNKIN